MFHLNERYPFFFFFGLETLVSGFCLLSVCSSVRFDVSVKDGDGRKCFSPPKGFLFLKVFVLFLWLWILLFFRFLVKTRHNSQRCSTLVRRHAKRPRAVSPRQISFSLDAVVMQSDFEPAVNMTNRDSRVDRAASIPTLQPAAPRRLPLSRHLISALCRPMGLLW